MNNAHLALGELHSKPWAMHPAHLKAMVATVARAAAGVLDMQAYAEAAKAETEMRAARARSMTASTGGAVAVIPIYGSISHRGSFWSYLFGGSSVEGFRAQFRQALDDNSVKAIVFDVDSPGGSTDGVDELSAEIFAARGKKKITAVSNCLNASAALYLSSAADKVVVSPSSLTGSVGVYCAHEDDSELLKNMGVKVTLISYGKNKTAGNPYEPASESYLENTQAMVNYFGGLFDAAMARNRGVKESTVSAKFGQGLVFNAKDAVAAGIADSVGTLDGVLATYGTARSAAVSMNGVTPEMQAAQADTDGDVDETPGACNCDCEACVDDNCEDCSNASCEDPNCVHKPSGHSPANASHIERDHMAMMLAL